MFIDSAPKEMAEWADKQTNKRTQSHEFELHAKYLTSVVEHATVWRRMGVAPND